VFGAIALSAYVLVRWLRRRVVGSVEQAPQD